MRGQKFKNLVKIFENSPMSFTMQNYNLEVRENKEAKIEGFKKILSLSQECIRISTKNMYISISGRNLKIKCLTYDSLLIQGFINKIEFNT